MELSTEDHDVDVPGIRRCLEHADVPGERRISLATNSVLASDVRDCRNLIYILLSGLCTVEWTSRPGRRRILDFLSPGDILDVAAIPPFDGLRVRSVQSSVVLEFRRDQLERKDFGEHMLIDVAVAFFGQYQRKHALLSAMLGSLNAEERVAALLIDLAKRLGAPDAKHHSGFQIPLTRRDIADYLALNADTLSRILSRFKTEGLLQQVGRDKIFIQDWNALLKFCPLTQAILDDGV